MEVKNRKLFKELIKKLALEILTDDELDEITTTVNAPGYSTPHAFVGKNKKKKNKKLKQSLKQVGYSMAEEIEYNLKLMIEDSKDKKKKKYKPGDVWERPNGDWAGKNSKGNVQGYKSKEDAESWSKDEVPNKKDSKKDEPESEKDAIEREEREELKKKANKGFFQSKWDKFGEKSTLDVIKTAKEKGEKAAQDIEKGDTPVGVGDTVKDFGDYKKGQQAAKKALRKKQAADDEKERKAAAAAAEKEKKKTEKETEKSKTKTKKKPKKKPVKKKVVKKKTVKEELDNKDIKRVKKLIRQVVADILRDLWIKRSVWKDK